MVTQLITNNYPYLITIPICLDVCFAIPIFQDVLNVVMSLLVINVQLAAISSLMPVISPSVRLRCVKLTVIFVRIRLIVKGVVMDFTWTPAPCNAVPINVNKTVFNVQMQQPVLPAGLVSMSVEESVWLVVQTVIRATLPAVYHVLQDTISVELPVLQVRTVTV